MVKHATGGILLIAGTCIGAGTLALPITTAQLGIGYSVLAFLICWVFMTASALLMLEANLRIAPGHNLIPMAQASLGTPGKVIAWITYLMLLYSLTAAYLNGASGWVIAQAYDLLGLTLNINQSAVFLVAIIALIVFAGHTIADWTNRVLMLGLGVTFVLLLFSTGNAFSFETLTAHETHWQWVMFPTLITTFGYHIVIPTLTVYIECNKTLRGIIIKGALIPLVTYLLWEVWVLGLLNTEQLTAVAVDPNTTAALASALQHLGKNPIIASLASAFTIFVIITSFIGVTLSLFDFLADGFGIKANTLVSRLGVTAVAFVPPLTFVLLYPAGFLFALSFAGMFVAILLGIYPALMVWQARYLMRTTTDYTVSGGKPLLLLVLAFFAGITGISIYMMV
ncbi:MAG: hypothetical protein CMF48_03210 [Legionellales bacterium]|nr:hypothetical protein [Legionellales bacterium]|tara:strand:- start:278 stop:1465 length:1188 start_codon:yes stop_codon:yes gene_type:complete